MPGILRNYRKFAPRSRGGMLTLEGYEMKTVKIYKGDFKKTLTNVKGDLILTSPPYNIGSESVAKTGKRSRKRGTYDPKSYRGIREYADTLPIEDYITSQIEFLNWCTDHLTDNGVLVYNHKPHRKNMKLVHPMEWISQCRNLILMEEIIWDRGSTHNHSNRLMWPQTERLYVLRKLGGGYPLMNDSRLRYRSDIWRMPRAKNNGHNAPFPEELAVSVIEAWCPAGGVVLDPYSGSGTTAVAAKKTGRTFYGSEIIDEYCQMSRARLQGIAA